jgi:hypothetical protein
MTSRVCCRTALPGLSPAFSTKFDGLRPQASTADVH